MGDALDTFLASLSTDMATMKSGATALQTAATALQADTTALRSDVTALRAQLSAAHRYSETCDPSTDPRLRSAWPGLSDAELTDACLRDGRWHALGTLLDFVMGTLTLPDGMEVGLTSYSRSIAPVTVNGWEQGTRFCLPPIAVGNVTIVGGPALLHECVTFMDNNFTVTHREVGQTTTDYNRHNYTGYSGGSEFDLPCTQGGGYSSCNDKESIASHWQLYVRQ